MDNSLFGTIMYQVLMFSDVKEPRSSNGVPQHDPVLGAGCHMCHLPTILGRSHDSPWSEGVLFWGAACAGPCCEFLLLNAVTVFIHLEKHCMALHEMGSSVCKVNEEFLIAPELV